MTTLTNAQLDTLRAGLDWLYRTEQADNASIVSHHGVNAPVADGRRYRFVPTGFHPAKAPVIVVAVAEPQYEGPMNRRKLVNPLEPSELAAIEAQLREWGHQIHSSWNGTHEDGSIGLVDPAHPSLLAALERQRQGCPDHPKKILCSWDGCSWHSTHIAKLQVPEGW